MGERINSLLAIKINFAESHTFFPTIFTWILLFLLLVIVLVHGIRLFRDLRQGRGKISIWAENFLQFSTSIRRRTPGVFDDLSQMRPV